MGLSLQPTRRTSGKIATLIAVFALIAQPMYGLVVDFVAKAAVGTVVVGQANHATTGWDIASVGATAEFEVVSAPLGSGALKMSKGMTQGDYVQFYRESMAAPMSLNDISFQYSSMRLSGSVTSAPGFGITVDTDGNLNTTDDVRWYMYEPTYNSSVSDYDVWNEWSIDSSSKVWQLSRPSGSPWVLHTISDLSAAHSSARVLDYWLNLGTGNNGSSVLVDRIVEGNAVIYDFEATPQITSIDAYFNQKTEPNKSWKGVGVDFRTQYISNPTKLELRINREDNTTYSAFAKQSVLDAINSEVTKQTPTLRSGVIAIQPGDYVGSWEQSSTPWTGTSAPLSVDIIITLADNSIVTLHDDTIGSNLATWEQVKPVDTAGPSVSKIRINGTTVSGAYSHDANCSTVDKLFTVGKSVNLTAAIGDDSDVAKASYKIRKLSNGGCTQSDIYSSGAIKLQQNSKNAANWNQVTAFDTNAAGLHGLYAVVLTTEDTLGNTSTKFIHLNIDNVSPTISWQVQPNAIYGAGDGFHVRPITSEVGTTKSVYIDSVAPANRVQTLTSDHKNFDTTNAHNQELWDGLSDGQHKFIAVFTDYAGNASVQSESREFTIDRTAPVVTIDSPSANSTVKGGTDIKATIVDENLSHYYLLVKVRADSSQPWTQLYKKTITSEAFADTTLYTLPSNISGEVYVQLEAKDKADNKDEQDSVKKIFFTLDNTAPTASISLNALLNPAFATVGISDSQSPQGQYVINVLSEDGTKSWRLCGLTSFALGETSADCTMLSTLLDGTYYLRANVLDAVGNNSASIMSGGAAISNNFIIDTTRPTVTIDSVDLSGDLLDVTVSGRDGLSGLLALGINIYAENNKGSALIPSLGRIKDGIAPGTLTDSETRSNIDVSSLAEGTYTVRAVAVDHADLYSAQVLERFTIDRTAPAISINSTTFTTTGVRTITGTVDDDAISVEASIDNGTTWSLATYAPGETTWSFPVSSGLANGSYPILARATDNNGNTGNGREASAQASFTVAVVTNPANTPAIEVNNSPQTEGTFTPNNTAQSVNALQVLPAGDTVVDSATDEEATDEDGEVAAAVTDNDDNGEVKAAEDVKDSWSLINLLLTIAVAAASIFALIDLAGKREDRNIGARLLTVVPALGAGAVLLFAEDFSGQMSWVNIWTLLVGALLVVQMILLANTKTETE